MNICISCSSSITNQNQMILCTHIKDCSLFIGSTGPVFRGMGQGLFLMLLSMGHKDFLCFYGTGHELFLEKNLSNYICIISRGVTPIDWNTRCAIFEGTFWLENKFLGLFYSL